MIEFVNVSKTYEDNNTHAVSNISMKIDDGEFVFLVGPSGSGKSTILKLIMREQLPTCGDIIIDGDVINKLKRRHVPYLRRKMGMVYQDFRLIERMNVFNNVAFAVRAVGGSYEDINERVPKVIKMVGLESKMEERPSQLSGGEQQRVSLARALVNNPKILIADEPTANVDYDMSVEIIKILKDIKQRGTTVIVVTHDKSLVELFGGRVIELSHGSIVRDNGGDTEKSSPEKEGARRAKPSILKILQEKVEIFRISLEIGIHVTYQFRLRIIETGFQGGAQSGIPAIGYIVEIRIHGTGGFDAFEAAVHGSVIHEQDTGFAKALRKES